MTIKPPGPLKPTRHIPTQAPRTARRTIAKPVRDLLAADSRAATYNEAPVDTFEPNKPNPFSKLLGSVDTSASRFADLGATSAEDPVLPGGAYAPTGRDSAATWEERLLPSRDPSAGEAEHLRPGLEGLARTAPTGVVIDGPGLGDGPDMERGSMGANLQRPLGDGVLEAVAMGAAAGAATAGVATAMSGGTAAPSIPAAAVTGGAVNGGLRVLSNAWDEVEKWFAEDDAPPATPEPSDAPPPPEPQDGPTPPAGDPSEEVDSIDEQLAHQVEPTGPDAAFPSWWRGTEFDPNRGQPEAGETRSREPRVGRPSGIEEPILTERRPKDSPVDPIDIGRNDRDGAHRLEGRTGVRAGPEVINPAIG